MFRGQAEDVGSDLVRKESLNMIRVGLITRVSCTESYAFVLWISGLTSIYMDHTACQSLGPLLSHRGNKVVINSFEAQHQADLRIKLDATQILH